MSSKCQHNCILSQLLLFTAKLSTVMLKIIILESENSSKHFAKQRGAYTGQVEKLGKFLRTDNP